VTHSVLLGISGGIAAYKIPFLVRLLKKAQMNVQIVMTEAAKQFVTPMTLAALSENRVWDNMWEDDHQPSVEHITLADAADVAVIAPATANIIGKITAGIADDLLTTVITAIRCPLLICPSMNVNMYNNPIVQRNLRELKKCGYHILDPEYGFLACGWTGAGRLPEPEIIFEAIQSAVCPKDLLGQKILVTAGPTEEPLDPVRFITNRSSGKMGVAVARRAAARGADVTLVAGPLKVPIPFNVKLSTVRTAQEMYEKVMTLFPQMDILIKAAAVADFRPASPRDSKMPKDELDKALQLETNLDIIKAVGSVKKDCQIVVGFAAETGQSIEKAKKKLTKKNADMIVVNDVSLPGAGFDHDTNVVTFILRSGEMEQHELMPKEMVADLILDRASALQRKVSPLL
jgi:phosphopantothenoylcysteine decarboxylase/phosphopantothenate--cysteine ligase